MATWIATSTDQQCDSNGVPMSGALIYVEDVGTSTLKNIYSDTALAVSAANPIVCDSSGRHDVRYCATGSYKIIVKTSAGVPVYTRDYLDGGIPVGTGILAVANGGTGAATAAGALAALGGATAAELAEVAAEVAGVTGSLGSIEKTHIATGSTAQRSATPAEGDIRRNTTLVQYEGYGTASWLKFLTDSDYATAAQMETASATNVIVTPAIVKSNPGVAKAWALVTVSGGVPTLTASHNCTNITDNGTGDFTINLTTAFSSVNYCIICQVKNAMDDQYAVTVMSQTASNIRILAKAFAGASTNTSASDVPSFYFAAFGDQ